MGLRTQKYLNQQTLDKLIGLEQTLTTQKIPSHVIISGTIFSQKKKGGRLLVITKTVKNEVCSMAMTCLACTVVAKYDLSGYIVLPVQMFISNRRLTQSRSSGEIIQLQKHLHPQLLQWIGDLWIGSAIHALVLQLQQAQIPRSSPPLPVHGNCFSTHISNRLKLI